MKARRAALALALALAAPAPSRALAQMTMTMPMGEARVKRDVPLFAALVRAGGGPPFRTATFLRAVTSGRPDETAALRHRFGAAKLAEFARVFEVAIAEATPSAGRLPVRVLGSADLAAALYRAGSSGGRFEIEHLFDTLLGPDVHDRVMADVAIRFGASGETVYHGVLTTLLIDLAAAPPRASVPATPSRTSAPDTSMPGMTMPDTSMPGMPGMPGTTVMPGMPGMTMRTMSAVTDVGVPMSREGSGTSWLPESTTTFGHLAMHGDDMLMTHGVGFARYSDTTGARGSRTLNAPNWFMAMGTHPLGASSQLGARAMLSGDVATVGGFGYPELFQTGETYGGRALHDHQHPHDLVSELSLTFSHRISARTSAFVYAGYPGEPALGPPAYMHREIAYDMADAPIGHHWEDSSHITFGVVTAGVTRGGVKLEGSTFTGREPDAVRTNFDPIHLDSYSARLSWNPTANVATQVSFGFLKSPEAETPSIDRRRLTASIVTNAPLGFGQFFTTTAVFGQNRDTDGSPRSNAFLLEADYHRTAGSVYARAELVQKSGDELALDQNATAFAAAPGIGARAFPIGALSVGAIRDLRLPGSGTVVGFGAQVTANARPAELAPFYGPAAPLGFELFARVRPAALR